MQMVNKHMKRLSTSLIIREVQLKTALSYHLIPGKTTINKKFTNKKC